MHSHTKQSTLAQMSLHAMRGKSWSSFQKHIPNFLADHETALSPSINNADVQRLDLNDYNLYGISPSDPGPMVLCNQCNHIMAPEGVKRHVKRIHGTKIVPATNSKVRTLLSSKGISTAGALLSSSNAGTNNNLSSISNSLASPASTYTIPGNLSNEFSNRLNVNSHDSSLSNEGANAVGTAATSLSSSSSLLSSVAISSATGRPSQLVITNAMAISNSSSNSNSPISSTKTKTSTSSSSSSKGRSRKQTSKDRDYDPEKHCGVRTGNMKPCTRSLTCKTHSVSLRRNVDGRSKPFDQLLSDHRNSTKDHKHSSNKQAYSIGENSNQMLDSIGDSNSSSSFDIERRSFSSNSNQSTIGNYNSDHSTAFSTSSSQQVSNQILGNQSMTLSMDITNNNRKINYTILSPHDERSTNITQFSDLSMNPNMASILQSCTNGPISLNSFNEYSVNDLINDDNGDAFDMTFWENFENINYEADVMMSGFNASTKKSLAITEHHKTSKLTTAKAIKNTTSPPSFSFSSSTSNSNKSSSNNNKRSNASFDESDRKRKRGNELKELKDKDNGNIENSIDMELSDEMQKFSDSLFGSDSIKTSKKIVVSGHSIVQKKSPSKVAKQTQGDVICIDDDDDDLVIVSDNTYNAIDKRSISPAVSKFCTNSKASKISIDLNPPISTSSKAPAFKSNEEQFHSQPPEPIEKKIPRPVKLPDPRLKEAKAALIEQSIIRMSLSNDNSVHSADLRNITKILSEQDHHHVLSTDNYASSATVESMDITKSVTLKPTEPKELKQKPHSPLEINVNKSMSKSSSTMNVNSTKGQTDTRTNDTTKSKPEPVILTKDGEQQPPKIEISAKVPVSENGNHLGTVPMDENENFLLDMMYKCLRGKRVQLSGSNHISAYNNYTTNYQQHIGTNRGLNGTDPMAHVREKENNAHAIETQNAQNSSDEENIKATNSLLLPLAQRSMSLKRTMAKPIIANQFAMARGYGVCHVRNAVSSTRAVQQNFFERMQAQQPNGPFSGTMMTIRNGSLIRLNNANANLSGVNATINQPKSNSPGPQSTNPANSMNSAAAANTANSSIVIVNSPNATMSGQSYTIFRRPSSAQNIQLITRKTIDQTYAVMPVIHCVRTRTMRPNVTKTLSLQTDQLLANLKTMTRPQKINNQALATTKKVISVYKSTLQQNAINYMQSRTKKFYHHTQASQPTISMASQQKQNGYHTHSASNGAISPRSGFKSGSQKKS